MSKAKIPNPAPQVVVPSGVAVSRPALKAGPVENAKWGHLVARYLVGNGIELATGGAPVVQTSIQFELPAAEYAKYNSNQPLRGPVQWRSMEAIRNLPFKDGVLDYVFSSHLIEDFLPADQLKLLTEWARVLKRPGGRLVICAPDKKRWEAAVAAGQCPNCAHRHEFYAGELSQYAAQLGLTVVCDKLTDTPPGDYNVLFVGQVS